MPHRPAVLRQAHGRYAGDLPEVGAQIVGVGAADFGFLHQLVELLHEKDRLRLGHPVIVAAGETPIPLVRPDSAAAVVEGVALVDQFLAHARDRAAFAGRNVLGFLEAEAPQVADRAALAALVFRQPRLAGILDHGQLVLAGNGVDRVHVARHAEDVHRHDGARPLRDAALDRGRVHGERGRVGVGKDRQGLAGEDGVVAGDEGVGRDDHLVAGVHVHDVQADDQRRGAAGGGQAALGAQQFGVAPLEVRHVLGGAAKPSAAPPDLEQLRLPGFAPLRPAEPTRPGGRACRRAGPAWPPRRRTPAAPGPRRASSGQRNPPPLVRMKLRRVNVRSSFMALLPRFGWFRDTASALSIVSAVLLYCHSWFSAYPFSSQRELFSAAVWCGVHAFGKQPDKHGWFVQWKVRASVVNFQHEGAGFDTQALNPLDNRGSIPLAHGLANQVLSFQAGQPRLGQA